MADEIENGAPVRKRRIVMGMDGSQKAEDVFNCEYWYLYLDLVFVFKVYTCTANMIRGGEFE